MNDDQSGGSGDGDLKRNDLENEGSGKRLSDSGDLAEGSGRNAPVERSGVPHFESKREKKRSGKALSYFDSSKLGSELKNDAGVDILDSVNEQEGSGDFTDARSEGNQLTESSGDGRLDLESKNEGSGQASDDADAAADKLLVEGSGDSHLKFEQHLSLIFKSP